MNQPLTIKRTLHFSRQTRGRRRLEPGPAPAAEPHPAGRVPRVSRLIALAIRFEQQVRTGQLASYSQLAALGHVTRARVSQIMNLVNLAPEIQEALLELSRTEQGRDAIILRDLQPIASTIDWHKQRRLWKALIDPTHRRDRGGR
jgi:hypothetical protein